VPEVGGIAAEELVGAFAAEDHLHVLTRGAREQERREDRRIREATWSKVVIEETFPVHLTPTWAPLATLTDVDRVLSYPQLVFLSRIERVPGAPGLLDQTHVLDGEPLPADGLAKVIQ